MKVFISADMEGIACVSARDEVTKGEDDYGPAQVQMTAEVAASCEGAFAAGAKEVWIKDAHWTGRNIDPRGLPKAEDKTLRLVRGWSGHPFSMVQELDESFDALVFIGYHSAASNAGNPLSHTLSSRLIAKLEINGAVASEFLVYSYAASLVRVPVTFLSGDEILCRESRLINERLETVSTMRGSGASIVAIPPWEAVKNIREGVERSLRSKSTVLPLPSEFRVQVHFRDHVEAFRRSFYPGAVLVGDYEVRFETRDYFDVLRLLQFMTLH